MGFSMAGMVIICDECGVEQRLFNHHATNKMFLAEAQRMAVSIGWQILPLNDKQITTLFKEGVNKVIPEHICPTCVAGKSGSKENGK